MAPMEYSGTQGKMINEKKVKSKISCQTPFKYFWRIILVCRRGLRIESFSIHGYFTCLIIIFWV
jgi:hypothetical protein